MSKPLDMTPEHVEFEDGSSASFYSIRQLEHLQQNQRVKYWLDHGCGAGTESTLMSNVGGKAYQSKPQRPS